MINRIDSGGQGVVIFSLIIIHNLHNNRNQRFTCYSGLRFKLLFSMCDDKDSRKRTTRASILAANRAASSSSESEEVGHAISSLCLAVKNVRLCSTTSEGSRLQYDCRCLVENWKKGVDVEISLIFGLVLWLP